MQTTDTQSIPIIEAGIGDLEHVVPLFDQYRMFYEQPSDIAQARRFLRARIEHRDSVIFLALEGEEEEETCLGFALLYPSFDSVQARPIWILNDLYVAADARNRGVAKALITRGRRLADDTGAKAVSLSTQKNNAPSRKLYESLGFKLDESFCTYYLRLDV